jgi:hypothetical protein
VLAALIPFLFRLPARFRLLFIVSGAVYVGGGIGVEIVSQLYADASGKWDPIYAALATLEETLEMLGVALLIYALLQRLATFSMSVPRPRTAETDQQQPVAK